MRRPAIKRRYLEQDDGSRPLQTVQPVFYVFIGVADQKPGAGGGHAELLRHFADRQAAHPVQLEGLAYSPRQFRKRLFHQLQPLAVIDDGFGRWRRVDDGIEGILRQVDTAETAFAAIMIDAEIARHRIEIGFGIVGSGTCRRW